MLRHFLREKLDSKLVRESAWKGTFGIALEYERQGSLLFLILRYIDYGTERYDLGALLNIVIVGHHMN